MDTSAYTNVCFWSREPRIGLPELRTTVDTDVCVVGLGGSGLNAVRELAAHGLSVVGIDAGDPGHGAAGRNGGLLLAGTAAFYHQACRQLGRDRAAAIYRLTLDEIDRMILELPGLARRTGSLRIAVSEAEEEDCRLQYEAMRRDDLPVSLYEGPEGTGLLFPNDAVYDPHQRCRRLTAHLTASGVPLFGYSPAVRIAPGQLDTPRGRVRCRTLMLVVDGNLERLLPELSPYVRTARLQMLATEPVLPLRYARPVYTRWGYDYWQQLPSGELLLGGGRDRFVDTEWTHRADPTEPVQAELDGLLAGLGISASITHRWGASVAYTSSGLPVAGEIRPGIWACGGYNGTGNLIGALCGRAVARSAIGQPAETDALFLSDPGSLS